MSRSNRSKEWQVGRCGTPPGCWSVCGSMLIRRSQFGEGDSPGCVQYHPVYQWLTGLEVVNYHTLAIFGFAIKEALEQLFIEVLGVLSHEGLITLERVMHEWDEG